MIKSLEIQKIVVNSAKNIDYLRLNNVKIFASIPLKIKSPYIKIANISVDNASSSVNSFTIDLFVTTNGKNNSQILEIMDCLQLKLEESIAQYIENNDTCLKIFNVYGIKYDVSEDLQSNFWYGHFYISIDVL